MNGAASPTIAVRGRWRVPVERFAKIAFAVAVVHTAMNFLLFWAGFAAGMASFNHGPSAWLAQGLFGLLGVLNLPAIYFKTGQWKVDHSVLTPVPSPAQFAWTAILAAVIAALFVLLFRNPAQTYRNAGSNDGLVNAGNDST